MREGRTIQSRLSKTHENKRDSNLVALSATLYSRGRFTLLWTCSQTRGSGDLDQRKDPYNPNSRTVKQVINSKHPVGHAASHDSTSFCKGYSFNCIDAKLILLRISGSFRPLVHFCCFYQGSPLVVVLPHVVLQGCKL